MITLFHPYIPEEAIKAASKQLSTRWIGQGELVDQFEDMWFQRLSNPNQAIAVGAGTDALHLAYILSGIKEGDEVICPVFTCLAGNMPILYLGAIPVFTDVQDDLNIDPDDIVRKITQKTKAISVVHYGGRVCNLDKIQEIADYHRVPVIEDAAQAHGSKYNDQYIGSISDFTCFSFQAIKMISTADGGMLTIKNPELVDIARRLRWFGIDRTIDYQDRWKHDISEMGYKYQMNDITAAMGIEALKLFDQTHKHFLELAKAYKEQLEDIDGITYIGGPSICTILVEEGRERLINKLKACGIESGMVHYRNDKYSVFPNSYCPNMDKLEGQYLALPQHYYLKVEDVEFICSRIRQGF